MRKERIIQFNEEIKTNKMECNIISTKITQVEDEIRTYLFNYPLHIQDRNNVRNILLKSKCHNDISRKIELATIINKLHNTKTAFLNKSFEEEEIENLLIHGQFNKLINIVEKKITKCFTTIQISIEIFELFNDPRNVLLLQKNVDNANVYHYITYIMYNFQNLMWEIIHNNPSITYCDNIKTQLNCKKDKDLLLDLICTTKLQIKKLLTHFCSSLYLSKTLPIEILSLVCDYLY
jgi:hypothetical protein